MAFQTVNGGSLRQLQVGDSITGFVTGFEPSAKYPDVTNVLMQTQDGEEVTIAGGGNMKYLIKDEKIKLNVLTRIERQADGQTKGKTSKRFLVQQDPEVTLADAAFAALGATDKPERAGNITKATEAGIAAQAKKLASSHKRG